MSGKPLTIGITGGIASGKSLAADYFRRKGFPVFLADPVAKELMVNDPEIRSGLISLFGSQVYTDEGLLNRSLISSRIFSDNGLREQVNQLVHNKVWLAFQEYCLVNRFSDLIFHESALTFQTGLNKKLDLVIFIETDEKVRSERALKREGMTPDAFRQRILAQGNLTDYRNQANYIITNNSSPEDLERELEEILRHITSTH